MPKSNSPQKSTPYTRIHHQQVGAERKGAGGIAEGKDRAECPEGNRRELMRDSNLKLWDSKREKINLQKALTEDTASPFTEQRKDSAIPEKS